MEETAANPRARRTSHYNGRAEAAGMAIGHGGGRVHELIKAAGNEVRELHFRDRKQAGERRPDTSPGDERLGDRGVDHALGTEAIEQALGHAEGAAADADVLAQTDDSGVVLHL